MKTALLIDGNSLMFRSYFATSYTGNLMQNSNGLYTNAIFGFCNMINKLLESKPDYVFVAFDAGKQTFRHLAYGEYKGGRKPTPQEFKVQIPYIKKYLDCLNIYHKEMFEYEADDLIATVSTLALNNNIDEIKVVSGDKDLLQLVRGNVKVCLTKKGITELEEYTEDNFFEKMGFYSNQIPDYKGLVGDNSDNLPGIKGIGEKTALKLLSEFKTLENIVSNASLIKGKTGEVIRNGAQTGLTCKKLATLVRDINIDFDMEDITLKDVKKEELVELYKELEFNSFLKRLEKDNLSEDENGASTNEISGFKEQNKEQIDVNYEIIDDIDFVCDFDKTIITIETNFNNYYNSSILGLAINANGKYYFMTENCLKNNVSLKEYLASSKEKVVFDYKKIYVCLKKIGLSINGVIFDGLLGIYLINPKDANDDFSLCVENYNDKYLLLSDKDLYGNKGIIPEIDKYSKQAITKVFVLSNIYQNIIKDIPNQKLLDLELGLSKVLGDMELNGLIVSNEVLDKCDKELGEKQKELESEIYRMAGEVFNINSPKQLGEILFVKLGLPSGKKNKSGYSTDSSILEYLSKDYYIATLILEYRKVSKIISTYVNGLRLVMDKNNYIHPLYKQALTVTGRLSSVEPNIQNMPIRDEVGQVIREAFVSRFDGGKIVSLDYSQIELRVLASMSNDTNMIKAFNSDVDFHKMTASWIFDKDPSDITKQERSSAKAINFGIVYGMSAWGLSEAIGISPKLAKEYITKYFMNYPGIDAFIKKTINDAKEKGYTETLFGRVRYIPELASMNKTIYQFGERTAINSPIQGTAADIIKMAMVKVGDFFEKNNLKSKLIAQVHDELVFDCESDEIDLIIENVKKIMENVVSLKVKLIAESDMGNNWREA